MKAFIYLLVIATLTVSCNHSSEKKKETIAYKQDQQTDLKASKERGGLVYTDFCMQCHLANGAGVPNTFPPLAQSNWLKDKRTESIHAVKYGQKGEITVNGKPYNGYMAPMGLTDEEVADVMNYVMNSWGNTQKKMVTTEEVSSVEK